MLVGINDAGIELANAQRICAVGHSFCGTDPGLCQAGNWTATRCEAGNFPRDAVLAHRVGSFTGYPRAPPEPEQWPLPRPPLQPPVCSLAHRFGQLDAMAFWAAVAVAESPSQLDASCQQIVPDSPFSVWFPISKSKRYVPLSTGPGSWPIGCGDHGRSSDHT